MSAPARAGTGASSVPAGTVVGARFRILGLVRSEAGIDLYQATDAQGGGRVLLRIVQGAPPAVRAVLESDLANVSRLQHKNLVTLLAFGDFAGQLFTAHEAEEAHTLRELMDARRAQGQAVGLQTAQTLLGHVAVGLGEAHRAMAHGALHPGWITVTAAGRVKVGGLGLGRALPALGRGGSPMGAPEGLYAAPELARGVPPTPAADVYSMGAMLYELVTGVPPAPPIRPPSELSAEATPAIDAVIARALSPQSSARFGSPAEMMTALGAAASGGAAPEAPRITLGTSFDVARAAGMSQDEERWLLQKDRLDYGPFSLTQIMAQIERGAFGPNDVIVDVESGERGQIKEHPLLGEFSVEAERKLEQVRRAQAEHVQEKVERKKSRATFVILGAVVIALGGGFALYLKNRKAAQEDALASRAGEEEVDAFIKQFKLDVVQKKNKAPRRWGGGGKDEFSGIQNLGDVSQGGGDEVLSDQKIQQVMMGNYRKLVPCIMDERRRNPGISDIDLEFVVRGNGKVSAVKVNGQRAGALPSCVLGRMQSFAFPSFNGKATIASWSMSMR